MYKHLISIILFLFCNTVYSTTSERIDGVAQFLIERASENYIYIFEKNIKENEDLKCYFGTTVESLKYAGLKELLVSSDLWEMSLKKDLDILLTRSTAKYIESSLELGELADKVWGEYIEALQKLQIKHNGKPYSLSVIPLYDGEEVKELINSFYSAPNEISLAMKYFTKFRNKSLCKTPVISSEDFKVKVDALKNIGDRLKSLRAVFKKNIKNISFTPTAKSKIGISVKEYVSRMMKSTDLGGKGNLDLLIKNINSLKEMSDLINDKNKSMTVKVINSLNKIKENSTQDTKDKIEKIQKYIIFFAQVRDADSKEEVTALLKAYTLPAVSFYEKRNRNQTWSISSYLGVTGSNSEVPIGEVKTGGVGIYAPIGIEWTYGAGYSYSIMVAPFDFGYPVNLKLNGIETEINYDEIVAPSILFSWGIKDYPLSIGIGVQEGRSFGNGLRTEKREFIHISFDMPLFILN